VFNNFSFLFYLLKEKCLGNTGFIYIVVVLVYVLILLIGLWPLDFFPENEVKWLKGKDGVRFKGEELSSRYSAGGIAYTPDPFFYQPDQLCEKGSVSIEILVNPDIELKKARARIISFYDNVNKDIIFIDQWKSYVDVFYQESENPSNHEYKKIGVGNTLLNNKISMLTITSGGSGTFIYVDGKLVRSYPDIRLFTENDSVIGKRVILGNSPEATNAWSGNFYGLAVYNSQLAENQVLSNYQWWMKKEDSLLSAQDALISLYAFNEGSGLLAHSRLGQQNPILIPEYLWFKKRILLPPDFSNLLKPNLLKDIIFNILGFIPLGFFSLWCLFKTRKWKSYHAIFLVTIFGFIISLCIEIAQIFLPARDSSQADIILNVLGIILGIILFNHFWNIINRFGRWEAQSR